jgi:hypothetical protein
MASPLMNRGSRTLLLVLLFAIPQAAVAAER